MRKHYTFGNFILDALLTVLTGGFWLLWIVCRELRNIANSRRY
jgi:hypothetical protein